MTKSTWRKVIPVSMGNMLENYDFCLYGLLAPVFAKVFFPPEFEHSLTAAFVLFATAYISRPLGGIIWGHIADKYGRKPVLMSTLTIMAIAAAGMAIVPDYSKIGIYSAIIVLFLRFLQGIAFGGEFPTTMVMLYELAPSNRKATITCLTSSGSCLGNLLGVLGILAILIYLGPEQFQAWGWRLLFGLSAVFVLLIGYLRANLMETLEKPKSTKFPVISAVKEWKTMFNIVSFEFISIILFFSYIYYINIFIKETHSLTEFGSYTMQAFMITYLMFSLPIVNYIADLVGHYKFSRYTLISLIIFIVPIYKLLLSKQFYFLGMFSLGLFVAAMVGMALSISVKHCKKSCTVSMISIIDGIATFIFGASAPIICMFLIEYFNTNLAPAYYLIISAIISLTALSFLKEKNYESASNMYRCSEGSLSISQHGEC